MATFRHIAQYPEPFRSDVSPETVAGLARTATDPEHILRWALRSYDRHVGPGIDAVWSAEAVPMSADDAADQHGRNRAFVREQLAKRSAYLKKIAAMVGVSADRAARVSISDLELVPASAVRSARSGIRIVPSPDVIHITNKRAKSASKKSAIKALRGN